MKTAAELVIERFGGVRPLARKIGRHASSVARWPLPRGSKTKGLGGSIPSALQQTILEIAEREGIPLTAEEVVYGERRPRNAGKLA